jgi:hypothetical protein
MRPMVAWNSRSLTARKACAAIWVVLMDMLFLSTLRSAAGYRRLIS